MLFKNYITYNGKIVSHKELSFGYSSRAFRYGDVLFENMHAYGSEVQFFGQHFSRLTKAMKLLQMPAPHNFTIEMLHKQIESLLHRNRFFGGTKVELCVFRAAKPGAVDYAIIAEQLGCDFYDINAKGLRVNVFEKVRVCANELSEFPTSQRLVHQLAGLFAQNKSLHDALLLNQKNYLVESTDSNIFVVKDGKIYTPALSDGCVAGVMREVLIDLAREKGYEVFDKCHVSPRALHKADEVFLSNAEKGIRWVVAFGERRYFSRLARRLTHELNQKIFGRQPAD